MKLFFLKDHSLYKIFKTLEKVPNGKTVHISIDPEHPFFDNERWGKQIQELIKQKNIHVFFITKTDASRRFFEKVWLPVIHQEKHKILKILQLIYYFFFNIKKFHLQAYTKKNYLFYMIFGFEILFVLIVLYLLYSLILPRTIIDIYPANQSEDIVYNFRYYPVNNTEYVNETKQLAVPFQTGFIDYKYTMSISVKNIKHIQNPSQGKIKIINPTDKEYPLLKWTRFVTSDWLVFKTKYRFILKPLWEQNIEVIAADKDENGNLIGARWNIKKDTKLYIKNIKESFFLKTIYAEAITDFSWWSLVSEGIVSNKDINTLSGRLVSTMQQQKQNIINENFSLPGQIFLHFNDLISMQVVSLVIENKENETVPYLKWTIVVRFNFAYIKQSDLFAQTQRYLQQRPSDKVKLLTIDRSSVVFFSTIKKDELWWYIIPTKLSIIQWYNFEKDINNILESIKNSIVGINKDKAKSLLLEYPEISSAAISIRPPWYSWITKLKSRVKINIIQEHE